MKVRIGIDVGGTFTDAAVIDNETYELIGSEKVPTTHSAATGVAAGIVEVLQAVMSSVEQIISIARIELSTVRDDDQLIYICSDRMD